jgi:transposase
VKHLGELDEGKLHVQFDVEGAGEILSFTLPKTLAYLLRGDLVAESYVPTRKNRDRRALIRHRASLMQMRVEVKNRIHALLDKHELSYKYTDLFGKQGLEWLRSLQLPTPDQQILHSSL